MRDGKSYREEGGRFYGFIEGSEPAPFESAYSRLNLVLDAVDADEYDRVLGAPIDRMSLAIIRITTTPNRLQNAFRLIRVPVEGDWVEVKLERRDNFPIAWLTTLADDYQGAERLNVVEMRIVDGAEPGGHLRASVDMKAADKRDSSLLEEFKRLSDFELHVRVVDVGQASCNAVHSGRSSTSPVLAYFDVGAPLFFHHSSLPSPFAEPLRVFDSGVVILSHWDFDHYAQALRSSSRLRQLKWYAPRQPVGPNAIAFQNSLSSLTILDLPSYREGQVGIFKCNGPTNDRNHSGYVMRIGNEQNASLLTGDASYEVIARQATVGIQGLTIPHHGGSGGAKPFTGSGPAVVSYGAPNKYKHPNDGVIGAHQKSGWTVTRTADHPGQRRGDRWL
ncbi:ComEC/Rec2 family competence protein [Bradyrhizobium symbiodeficiens]|uniref:Uncharacterized protein n=1 Tax=Bradyrhizobium symbiodeficiens TaxID=1404367 RepID=A0A6G8ZZT3_9BRAD|nr:hypothetical protein [Bradyrhizobium symbiodeficiens]QIP05609.1 hypothetical protein HAV00_04800 [Bradyrhizobium symbiodeficiens]